MLEFGNGLSTEIALEESGSQITPHLEIFRIQSLSFAILADR
jgi:hypothetical protein